MQPLGEVTLRPRVLAPGTTMGRYTIVRRIGSGGMAELYLVRARGIGGFDKLFALKLVLPHVADDPEFIAMFLDEARLAGTLDHPNIAHVVDIGRVGDDHFYAMEYVHGRDLRSILKTAPPGPMPLEVALSLVLPAAAGLHHAHERCGPDGVPLQLVHRDVSPSNLLVTFDGVVKLVDFGIARAEARSKATQAGVVKGKRGYMSPEQCRGDVVDRRSDVFALGILLWELTVGQRLFVGDHDYAVMSKIVFGMVPDPRQLQPDYPPALAEIVMRALHRDPAQRPATAQALGLELEAFAHAARLRVGHHGLAEYMHGLFGDEPYPTFGKGSMGAGADAAPVDEDAATRMAAELAPRRGPTRAAVVVAAVAAVGVVAAMGVGALQWWRSTQTAHSTAAAIASEPAGADAIEPAPTEPAAAAEPASARGLAVPPNDAPERGVVAGGMAGDGAHTPDPAGADAVFGDDAVVDIELAPDDVEDDAAPPPISSARKVKPRVRAAAGTRPSVDAPVPSAAGPHAPTPSRPNALFPPHD
ncbi:MAG: serine/threonine protein kinase [Deltaproteobacteria bacterium]|nr:serine/threonine protein kinase [Deltaproteobacteria bacterium]MBK8717037.1 serine/threonine protein kinase [Deltaproteobacteria bacterium]MBP7290630.1 serine/threonine protein kinase [Nannocystaceae bacterium]